MPIRLTCPSCSAVLSVKDEYAGRAVKCPKCGGVIPASAAAPAAPAAPAPAPAAPAAASPPPSKSAPAMPAVPPPAPAPEPAKSPFEDLDKPAKKSKAKDEDEDDDDRPKKKKSRDEDDEDDDRPKKKKRDRDDEDERDEKPEKGKKDKAEKGEKGDKDEDEETSEKGKDKKKKRRDDDDDDDDDRKGKGKKKEKKKGGGGMILLIVGGLLLLCCAGGGGLGYYIYTEMRDKVQDVLNPKNDKVTFANYEKIKYGMTKSEVEGILGQGKLLTRDHLVYVSNGAELKVKQPNIFTQAREDVWASRCAQDRVYMWQNDADAVVLGFHPDGSSSARVQMKEFISRTGKNELELGIYKDDAAFLKKFPKGAGPGPGPGGGGDAIEVSAKDLIKAFKDDTNAAKSKYMDKELIVEGELYDIEVIGDDVTARLLGGDKAYVHCNVQKSDAKEVWKTSRTQTAKFRGKCIFGIADAVTLGDCKFVSRGPDPAPSMVAAVLINEFRTNASGSETKYKDKPITITNARVESKTGNSVTLTGVGKAKDNIRIKATLPADYTKQLNDTSVNEIISIKGELSSYDETDKVISINRAYIAK